MRIPRSLGPRVLYPIAGLALGLGAPGGWLLVRACSGHLASSSALAAEVSGDRGLYAYLLVATCAAFSIFGYFLGSTAERLRQSAACDHLTGLATRQRLYEFLDREFAEAVRYGRPLSFVMVDVDHFKLVNDRHGHAAGDEVLRAVARTLLENKRQPDVAARFGGEEFLLILPETTVEEAEVLAERIRREIAAIRVDVGGSLIGVTSSFGVAGGIPPIGDRPDDVIEAADEALYDAKRMGRDRVVVRHPGEVRRPDTGTKRRVEPTP